jgi:hypothetical protein
VITKPFTDLFLGWIKNINVPDKVYQLPILRHGRPYKGIANALPHREMISLQEVISLEEKVKIEKKGEKQRNKGNF